MGGCDDVGGEDGGGGGFWEWEGWFLVEKGIGIGGEDVKEYGGGGVGWVGIGGIWMLGWNCG